jgi:hypothetical protein
MRRRAHALASQVRAEDNWGMDQKSSVDEFLDAQAQKAEKVRQFFGELDQLMRELQQLVKEYEGKTPMNGPIEFCCDMMRQEAERVCEDHPDRSACPDCLIERSTDGTYGLLIHDGGSSRMRIRYCPWCGCELIGSDGP